MSEKQFSNKDIKDALQEAGKHIERIVKAYLIGGCAMTFRNLKPSTKDADLLFAEEIDEQRLFKALMQTGFKELFPGSYDVPLKAKDILINENGLQFDLFSKQVMGGLRLSPAMKKRAEKYAEYGKLTVLLGSKEDIYLFKAITDRPFPRDFEDLLTLQQSGLDWKAIIGEYESQVKGRPIEENLLKKMELLKRHGIINPLNRLVAKS
jgi:hypothetical protein